MSEQDRKKTINRERQRRWLAQPGNLEKQRRRQRDYRMRTKHGLTVEDRERIRIEQDNRCAVCRTDDPGARDWHMDHDHTTKKVRGLLCQRCNFMIGNAKDNPKILVAGALYLQKFQDHKIPS